MDVFVHRSLDAGVTQQLLQYLGLHPALDCPRSIGVAQGVHTEMLYTCPVTQLIQVRIIAAVLCGHSGTKVDEDKVAHIHLCLFRCSPVNIGQHFVQFGGFFALFPDLIQVPQDLIGSIR